MFDFNYNREVAREIQAKCEQYIEYIDIVAQHAMLTQKIFALSQDIYIDERVLSHSLACDLILKNNGNYNNRTGALRRGFSSLVTRG